MRAVGIHIRIVQTMQEVIQKAMRLHIPFFQLFFIQQQTRSLITISSKHIDNLRALRRKYFGDIYVHGSYYINLGQIDMRVHPLLRHEMSMAQQLECNFMVLHAGYTKGSIRRLDGIDSMARILNTLCKQSDTLPIIMENSAHAGMSLGSDFNDFKLLKEKLDKPEQLFFCVDTAHAHAFGYDLISDEGQSSFIRILQETMGLSNIVLIHLNDTIHAAKSYIDQHARLDEGVIGLARLKRLVSHSRLQDIRLLLELPIIEESAEQKIINTIRSW